MSVYHSCRVRRHPEKDNQSKSTIVKEIEELKKEVKKMKTHSINFNPFSVKLPDR